MISAGTLPRSVQVSSKNTSIYSYTTTSNLFFKRDTGAIFKK
jgi:hypothetical protein